MSDLLDWSEARTLGPGETLVVRLKPGMHLTPADIDHLRATVRPELRGRVVIVDGDFDITDTVPVPRDLLDQLARWTDPRVARHLPPSLVAVLRQLPASDT